MTKNHVWVFPCELIENYDGDSVELSMDLGFGIRKISKCRLEGIDTPELRGGTRESKAAAKLARDYVEKVCKEAKKLDFFSRTHKGKYGRPLGELYVDGLPLTNMLVDENLGVAYDGGSKSEIAEKHAANLTLLLAAGRLEPYLS